MSAGYQELRVDTGEGLDEPITYQDGTPPTTVDLSSNYFARASFWSLDGVMLEITNVLSADGQIELSSGASSTPNMHLKLTAVGTRKLTSSGEWELWVGVVGNDPLKLLAGRLKVVQSSNAG